MPGSVHPLATHLSVCSSLHSCLPNPRRNRSSCTKIPALICSPSSFLPVFSSPPRLKTGRYSGAQRMCGCGRKPVTASATVLFWKLSKLLMALVGVPQPVLFDRACDGRELNEGIQNNKGPETNSSLVLTLSSSVKTGATGWS